MYFILYSDCEIDFILTVILALLLIWLLLQLLHIIVIRVSSHIYQVLINSLYSNYPSRG